MTHSIYKLNNFTFLKKMAAFDYDWTLVNPKNGKTFPANIDDWEWLHKCIPEIIKDYHNNGYMIVIFTNQSKKWKHEQIKLALGSLEIPIFIVIATDKEYYKPNKFIFDKFIGDYNIDKENSFFVGDALGRKSDFSDSDKIFAENIGIKIYSPEKFFKIQKQKIEIPKIELSANPEIIIMMGYPGSGKTTIAKHISTTNNNYIHVPSDIYKTFSKMKKVANEHIINKKSIIFDATNSSIKKRKEILEYATKHNYEVKCIHVNTSLDISFKRNRLRIDKEQVPKIAYNVYKKYYEEPSETEGFKLIII